MHIKIKKILCPVDFSDMSERCLQYAVTCAAAHKANLEVLHVMELPFLPSYSTAALDSSMNGLVERVGKECENRLIALLDKYRDQCPNISHRVVVGTPFMEIIHMAKDEHFDLIVMGTRGHTGIRHILLGSVASKVVRNAPCPVLTVKIEKHEEE